MPGSMILLIEKNSPKEVAQVIDAVMKMRSIAAVASTTPATVAGIGYVSVSTSAIIERKKRATQSNAASKNAHAETSPRAAGSIAPTCTLHSWMAFRKHSYDQHAFGDIVAHYLRVSYVRQNDTDIARNDQGSTAALTMAAQPTSNSNQVQQNNLAAHTRGMSGAFDMDARSASNSSQVQQDNLAADTRGMTNAFDMVAQPELAQQYMPPQSKSAQ
ncbi:hypothetical protein D6C98_04897 [Aureobasidium pullulans]|nr:hypothetical protein D6C98_04897 [Aureobasidium pullulans]